MEEDHENPTGIDSYVDRALLKNIICLNKKRKFLPEQSGLPQPKHKCFGHGISSGCDPSGKKNFSIPDFPLIINQKSDKGECTSTDADSLIDSNSFVTDLNSVSSYESKSEQEITWTYSYGQPSTSFTNWENDSIKMDASKEEVTVIAGSEEHDSFHTGNAFSEYQNLEDQLLEFGNHADYGFSGYGDDKMENSEVEEGEDTLHLDKKNSNVFVLSSGRWSISREAQSSSRKPTIDQEFEQYFSSLML